MPTPPTPALSPLSWDVFCNVVDNYGDIGVCWRLARQLAHEQGAAVRLWVDDLASFAKLCPSIDRQADSQVLQGIDIRQWTADFPAVTPQRCVIEAFGCRLPNSFKAAMAAQTPKPVWINLEYLSAESWIEGCHGLPSPDPRLPLVKYFYFPGFVAHSGGLLREAGLLAARRQFRADPAQRAALLAGYGLPDDGALLVSLFCYANPALPGLFAAWAEGDQPVRCLIPEGVASDQLAAFFGQPQANTGALLQQGALEVRVLPFVEQDAYDRLLWAADLCFVRGEDSFIRAQWAAQPFVWHIYPQEEEAHRVKLDAFLERYLSGSPAEQQPQTRASLPLQGGGQKGDGVKKGLAGLPHPHPNPAVSLPLRRSAGGEQCSQKNLPRPLEGEGVPIRTMALGLPAPAAALLRDFWHAWNAGDAARCRAAWPALRQQLPQLRTHAEAWAEQQNQLGDLATNLARFCASQV